MLNMKKILGFGCAAALCLGMTACAGESSSSSSAESDANVAPVTESSSSDSASAGQMNVNITLTEDVTNPANQDSPLQFTGEQTTVAVADGATVLDALQATGREIETSGSGDSVEVESIGGLAKGAAGAGSHWEYSVNGNAITASPAVYVLSDGDDLVFTFVH